MELSECPTGLLVSLVHDLFCIFSFPMLVAKYHAMCSSTSFISTYFGRIFVIRTTGKTANTQHTYLRQ